MTTPQQAAIIPPALGWEEHTLYLVKVAYNSNNIIHEAYLKVGFLNGPNATPGGYSEIWDSNYDHAMPFRKAYYLKVIKKLHQEKEEEPQSAPSGGALTPIPLHRAVLNAVEALRQADPDTYLNLGASLGVPGNAAVMPFHPFWETPAAFELYESILKLLPERTLVDLLQSQGVITQPGSGPGHD